INDSRVLIDESIVPFGHALRTILTASYEHEDEAACARVNYLFRWLQQVDNSDWIPPALLYLKHYHHTPDRLVRFLTELERLAGSLMIRRQYLNKRRQRYARLIAAIHAGDDLARAGSPILLDREECDTTIGQLNGEFYLMVASPRNYVLRRLDSSLAGAEAVYDQPVMTVEHVLPRTVIEGSEWSKWYPTRDLRDRWTHRLGNLALLSRSKNSNASNYDFARKKQSYFAARNGVSPFALTTQILREEAWTPDVVERRQRELIDQLRRLWRL
ncbi:MAG TPA: HNH endonuclease family protein, partial [Terriglobales bacterium]|nr:HNH endonuclease family protein [Terriglobales bacterium]